jgi:hypothetical protein
MTGLKDPLYIKSVAVGKVGPHCEMKIINPETG